MSGTTEVVGTEGPGLVAVNSVRIAYTSTGSVGAPLVLVHGSWGSHHNWDPVIPGLAEHYRVVAYDRRGHSESERPRGQGQLHRGRGRPGCADRASLISRRPGWPVTRPGPVITLKLAAARPDLLHGIVVHEPPLFGAARSGQP